MVEKRKTPDDVALETEAVTDHLSLKMACFLKKILTYFFIYFYIQFTSSL